MLIEYNLIDNAVSTNIATCSYIYIRTSIAVLGYIHYVYTLILNIYKHIPVYTLKYTGTMITKLQLNGYVN